MRLYPNWEQLNQMNNPLTEGERALIKYLCRDISMERNVFNTLKKRTLR